MYSENIGFERVFTQKLYFEETTCFYCFRTTKISLFLIKIGIEDLAAFPQNPNNNNELVDVDQ